MVLLLVLGLLSVGFVAMLVYLFLGPDGTTVPDRSLAGHRAMGPTR